MGRNRADLTEECQLTSPKLRFSVQYVRFPRAVPTNSQFTEFPKLRHFRLRMWAYRRLLQQVLVSATGDSPSGQGRSTRRSRAGQHGTARDSTGQHKKLRAAGRGERRARGRPEASRQKGLASAGRSASARGGVRNGVGQRRKVRGDCSARGAGRARAEVASRIPGTDAGITIGPLCLGSSTTAVGVSSEPRLMLQHSS